MAKLIAKALSFIVYLSLAGCVLDNDSSLRAYSYFIDPETCKNKQVNSCPIKPVSEILFAIRKGASTVEYRDVALNDSNNKTYGKLENCTVFDNENFKCSDLELIDGRFHLINAFFIDNQGQISKNNDNFFSNYFVISSSKSLYFLSSVKPLIALGLFHEMQQYEFIYIVILLMVISIPLGLISFVYSAVFWIFEYTKKLIRHEKFY